MKKTPLPPEAAKKDLRITVHGDVRVDEYAWLREKDQPEVRQYIEAENAYADAMMKPTVKLQRELYKEIRSRMKENDMTVPIKDGPYEYYARVKKGKQYSIHCRKNLTSGREEIILDENALAKGQKFFSMGSAEVDPSHNLLAYTVDLSGAEKFTLYIKDLRSGKLLSESIDSVSDVVWAEDGEHLFYTVEEHPHPPRKAYVHKLGSDSANDVLVFEEQDPQWYVALDKSRSKEYIFFISGNFDMTETRFVLANEPLAPIKLFAPRRKEVKYFVEHHGEYFYIMTNEKAVNFKIMCTPVSAPDKRNWKTWMPHDRDRALSGLMTFTDFFALSVREKGLEELYIHKPGEKKGRKVKFPENEHALFAWGGLEYESPYIRITYQSLLTPKTVYDYDFATGKLEVRKRQEVPGWNSRGFVSKREWVTSGNVKVPVILMHSKKMKMDGSAPMLLEAYGAYGITSDPVFSITKLSLLKRGWIIAIAHPRGGGEMGWNWHKQAKLKTKHRTYEDMVAVAAHLCKRKYTSRDRLALIGGSAGGMMVGAVLNMRPDLFGAAISYVPAADVLTSASDESLGGTRLHYDEIGDPRKPDHYRYIKKWSPYEAVKPLDYPALLVRANLNDIRTPYWEAAKWVARLRAKKTDGSPLLFKTETVAGHFGRSGRYEWIKDRAFDFAFLISAITGKLG